MRSKALLIFLSCLFIFGTAASVSALHIDFDGAFMLTDEEDGDGIRETITLVGEINGSGTITDWLADIDAFSVPGSVDTMIDLTDQIQFTPPFKIDVDSRTEIEVVTPGGSFYLYTYGFDPSVYQDAFRIWDDETGDLLLVADLTPVQLMAIGQDGLIDSNATVNLTNIRYGESNEFGTHGGYLDAVSYYGGASDIVEGFINATEGISNLSLNFSGVNFDDVIQGNTAAQYYNTFSGSATPLPEPGSMVLLGIGLIGVAGLFRHHRLLTK